MNCMSQRKNSLNFILKEIKNNPKITQRELAYKYDYSERNIRRYFKILKDKDYIKYVSKGKKSKWIILKE